MKALKQISVLLLLALVTVSCEFEEKQMGLPKNVTFSLEGGEQLHVATQSFTLLLIGEGTSEYSSDESDGYISVQHKWLTAKSPIGSKELTITAAPSDDNTSRSLTIYVYSGNEYATIKVKQK